MKPFEATYRIGKSASTTPAGQLTKNPPFTKAENDILQNLLNNYSKVKGRQLTQIEVQDFVSGFTSGISYLGRSGCRVIWPDGIIQG